MKESGIWPMIYEKLSHIENVLSTIEVGEGVGDKVLIHTCHAVRNIKYELDMGNLHK